MLKEKKQLYEGMYILSTTLSEDARQKALEKITSGIEERKGEVHKIHDQGRRRLAYEIKGSREGHYYVIYFTAPPSIIKDLWRDYLLNEDLARFLTLRIEPEQMLEKIEFKSLVEV